MSQKKKNADISSGLCIALWDSVYFGKRSICILGIW